MVKPPDNELLEKLIDDFGARFLIVDVRRNDLATAIVSAVHSPSEPQNAYGSMLVAVL